MLSGTGMRVNFHRTHDVESSLFGFPLSRSFNRLHDLCVRTCQEMLPNGGVVGMNGRSHGLCLFSRMALVLDRIARIGMGVSLLAATAVMFGQVILRYCFGIAFTWAEELVRYSGVLLALFGLSPLTRGDGIVRVDLFHNRRKSCKLLRIALDAFVGFCLIVLTVKGVRLASFGMMSRTPGMRIPFGIVYAAIPVGGAMGIIQLVDRWIRERE